MALTTELKYGSLLVIEVETAKGTEKITIEPIRKSGRSVRLRVEANPEVNITRI
jgi:hypothetical protein